MTQHYRLLTKEEIARLEAQHCIASDWTGVEVADDFHTDYIHHTRFSGKVRLGVFEKEFTLAGGIKKTFRIVLCYFAQCNGGRQLLH